MKINNVLLTPLKIIKNEKGNIYHSMKNIDPGYNGFGEAYFSSINLNVIKAWKKHTKMTLNLTVPVGEVKFVFFDDQENSSTKGCIDEITLSTGNYFRLTIPPNIWMGFKGLGAGTNLILNVADILHDPNEQINIDPSEINIPYEWSNK